MQKWVAAGTVVLGALWSCGDSGGDAPPLPISSGSGGASSGSGAGASVGGGATGGSGGGEPVCEPFGRFPAPDSSFTLPLDESTFYPDVQDAFPEVDWQTLDRLYLPAGEYPQLRLGNLPDRDASRPLVITNLGGQVKIGPADDQNYIWTMSGGSNWVLTGRYDPEAQTGDEAFPGHRCGDYAGSRGRYGFLSDDAFDLDAPYLHMGLSIGDASDYEVEFIEVTLSGFAGIRMLNRDSKPMSNVRLHDTYVHDVDGEGIYLGWTGAPPSELIDGLEVYDNRFVRTGNEALQVQNLGAGTHIHHNVMAYAALHWRDNGLGDFQDSNAQMQLREGDVLVESNLFVGSAATLWSLFRGPEGDDGPSTFTVRNNYVAHNKVGLGAYLGGEATAATSYRFEANVFHHIDFSYTEVDPGATDALVIFRLGGQVNAAVELVDNRWQGDEQLVAGLDGGDGTQDNVTATGNVQGMVTPLEVRDGLEVDVPGLEFWTAATTRAPGSPPRVYQPGDVVVFEDGHLYRATAESENQPPDDSPALWEQLPDPKDDFRPVDGSPYAGWGAR